MSTDRLSLAFIAILWSEPSLTLFFRFRDTETAIQYAFYSPRSYELMPCATRRFFHVSHQPSPSLRACRETRRRAETRPFTHCLEICLAPTDLPCIPPNQSLDLTLSLSGTESGCQTARGTRGSGCLQSKVTRSLSFVSTSPARRRQRLLPYPFILRTVTGESLPLAARQNSNV